MSAKDELITIIAEATGAPRSKAGLALDQVTDHIAGELARGNKVWLYGFGTFHPMTRAGSDGRNPKTGEKIKIAPQHTARFKPGKTLRDRLAEAAA